MEELLKNEIINIQIHAHVLKELAECFQIIAEEVKKVPPTEPEMVPALEKIRAELHLLTDALSEVIGTWAQGPPEEVARRAESFTGQYLTRVLQPS